MALTADDVREILRIVDESELDELRIEVEDLFLHVRRSGAPLAAPAAVSSEPESRSGAGSSRTPRSASSR